MSPTEHSCPTNGAMFTQLDLSTVSRISTGMDIYCFLSQTLTSTSHIGLDSVSASYQQWFVDIDCGDCRTFCGYSQFWQCQEFLSQDIKIKAEVDEPERVSRADVFCLLCSTSFTFFRFGQQDVRGW